MGFIGVNGVKRRAQKEVEEIVGDKGNAKIKKYIILLETRNRVRQGYSLGIFYLGKAFGIRKECLKASFVPVLFRPYLVNCAY